MITKVRMKIPEKPEMIVEIPDNGSNKKIQEGERVIEEDIKQAKRIIRLKNESAEEADGKGGTVSDESLEEMMDLTYGDLKPSGVSDSLALGAPKTNKQGQEIYDKFVQRFTVLLTSNFGTKLERILQQAFPGVTSFLGYLQRSTIILSILYRFPNAEPNEIIDTLRRHRVLYRTYMMWNKRMMDALDTDLLGSRNKKATSKTVGPAIKKYPKYDHVIKRDFNKTVRQLKTPKSSLANPFHNEQLIKDNLQECIDAMKDAEVEGDKDQVHFWKGEIKKLEEALENLKREEKHMKHAANLVKNRPVESKLNKSILRKGLGDEQLDPRVYIGTMIEGPLNIPILFDGTTDTYTEGETGAIISNRRLVENPWLELTADGFRKISQMSIIYDKKMPLLIKKTSETTKIQPTDYYEKKLQPSLKNVVDRKDDVVPAIDGAQPVGGDPNLLEKVESADKNRLRQRLKSCKEDLRHLKEMRTNATSNKSKSGKNPGGYVEKVSKLNERIRKAEEKLANIQKQISKASFMNCNVEMSSDEVEADIIPSNDPHILAHDDMEVHLNGAGFTLEMVHPKENEIRCYAAWYHGVPLNGVSNDEKENKSILGGALFSACQGTNFAPVGEGWTEETNDNGENTDVFKMLDKTSKTMCCVNVSTNHISFYAVA